LKLAGMMTEIRLGASHDAAALGEAIATNIFGNSNAACADISRLLLLESGVGLP